MIFFFFFAGGWISRQTPKCCRICPLHLRVAEVPTRDTSLVGTIPLPALLIVLHPVSLSSPSTREKTRRKAEDAPRLPIPPGSEVAKEESRAIMQPASERSDPHGPSNGGY